MLEKGVFFELMYFPTIQDTTCRRNIINKAHLYHQYGKSRNIIITSGALNHLSLRAPYDVINMYPFFVGNKYIYIYIYSTFCQAKHLYK